MLNTLGPLGPDARRDGLAGVLESPVFELRGTKTSFLIGGGSHANTYVALCDAATGQELMKAHGQDAHALRRTNWDVTRLRGRKVFLRIVDRHTGGWGHVVFDDFSTEGVLDAEATARRWKALAAPGG
ncbi:hypothetical protein HQ576_13010 [bacterium]|nr:hypothetical protein [bacterium]